MKAYTNLEQSKKLEKILPIESADMYYMNGTKHVLVIPNYETDFFNLQENDIPCWSLAALLEVMPKGTDIIKEEADTENEKYMCTVGIKDDIISTFASNPVDACVEMILKLHKQNLF